MAIVKRFGKVSDSITVKNDAKLFGDHKAKSPVSHHVKSVRKHAVHGKTHAGARKKRA